MERNNYKTDINDNQWEMLEKLLKNNSKAGRPPKYELREIVNAIFLLGIHWMSMARTSS